MRKFWTAEKARILKELVESNKDWNKIAEEIGVTVNAIKSRASKLGLKHISTYGKLTVEQLDYIKREYPNKTIYKLKTELGSSWATVKNAIEQMGIEVNIEKAWTDSDIEQLRQLALEESVAGIANKMNRTTNAVYLKAKKMGIILRHSPREWTKEEEGLLRENWGTLSITTIAESIKRDKKAVLQKAHVMKLGSIYNSTEYITVTEFQEFTGITRDRITMTLVPKYGFPLKKKVLINKKMQLIELQEAIKWMEKHQELFDGSKVVQDIFIPEPDWLIKKRRQDYTTKDSINYHLLKRKWTNADIEYAKSLLNSGFTHEQIAEKVNRSVASVQARLCKEGKAYRLKRFWTGKEFKFIQDNYTTMTDKEIANELNRTAKSVAYQRVNLGIKKHKKSK